MIVGIAVMMVMSAACGNLESWEDRWKSGPDVDGNVYMDTRLSLDGGILQTRSDNPSDENQISDVNIFIFNANGGTGTMEKVLARMQALEEQKKEEE